MWLLPLFLIMIALPAMADDMKVGPLTVKAGTMASGVIAVPKGVDAGTEIPITVFRGARPGPVLALVAGNHGYEYPPILALDRMRPQVDPKKLAGTVIMVHIANMPSFLGRTIYFSPVDGKNLNRVYPGKKDGTVSERIAYALTKEVIEKSDYLLDLHCGDGNESLRPYAYQTVTGDKKMDDAIAEMALAFGLDHIVIDRGRPTDPQASLYCESTAITRGKPAITVESGSQGSRDDASVERIVAGVFGVMRHLKMLESPAAAPPVAKPVYLDPTEVLNSPATGIMYPHVARGQTVKKGQVLVHITDFFGKRIAEVRAPFDGEVLYIVATPPINTGQPVGMIGTPK